MIKNKTYRNFMIIMNRLMNKGYDKEEAENLTHKCFDNSEQDGRSPEVFESMILRKSEYDKVYN